MRLAALALFLSTSCALAEVKLPAIISDHMVVQSGTEVPIWGWADAGEEVSVTLADQTATTKTSPDGKWQVKLGQLKSSPEAQTLTVKGSNTLTVQDVLIGEVWLGSGQSNMGMTVSSSENYEEEQKLANLPQVRMFTVERASMTTPQKDCKGTWQVSSAETVGRFSAAAYFFGREIHKVLKQPVGLINSSWGGTAIEAWTSMPAQSKLPEYKTISASWEEAKKQPWDAAKEKAKDEAAMAKWKTEVAAAKAAKKTAPRAPLATVEPRLHQNHPANLYNGMIAPIIPYAIRGTIWYQGEHNSGKTYVDLYSLQLKTLIQDWRTRWGYDFPFAWVQLPDYRAPQLSPEVIQTWPIIREQMLKTLSVPKTGMAVTLGLGDEKDIHPKKKQEVGRRLSLWALGTVYDQKVPATSGPVLKSHEIKGKTVTLTFDHANGGLKSKDGSDELKGFAIAGEDRRFVWARAHIAGNKVLVDAASVANPVAVRYAWADNPVWSLQNGAGLPASPFRTDDWKTELKLPAIFGDHMVVQANAPVSVWGWAPYGEEITVTLGTETATAKAASNGTWSTRLKAQPASDKPQELIVKGSKTLTFKDVLIGEVWLASGQSNMAFKFNRGEYPPAETAAANLPQVRMFTVKQHSTRVPQDDCEGEWIVATPETVQNFSAVAWFFGRDLHLKLKTPVGMINSSWGGTDIAAWTSEDAQAKVPALKAGLDKWAKDAAEFDPVKTKADNAKRATAWKGAVERIKAKGGKEFPRAPRPQVAPLTSQNHPANLYNGMIQPLIPYSIRGAIWYQGEHNCSTEEKASLYATQLPLMISDWRAKWRNNFAFGTVQLPNYEQEAYRPLVREAMLKSLSVPNTGMAVTIDVGEAKDNHPKDKKTVGERLSLWAQARVYRQKLPAYSGPTVRSHEVKNGTVQIRFDNATGGLKIKGDTPQGFVIAGADKQWKPAQVKINSNLMVFSHPDIKEPVAVRYAWSANPAASLFNGEGLPASPFRTDDWKMTEPAPLQ
ncbi:sialate O-acetylesterase [Prosthecobacter sp. SYSU 5D2]|uniref:sialate O-acetylesterase n=1 Tax=Prosthecobacter sp. SYSU 5D2 TaxID=3134134 RepID=UPI0031FEB382